MKRYFIEIVLGAVLVVVFFGASVWQSTGTLSESEVDRHIGILEAKR